MEFVTNMFGYNLDITIEEIRRTYKFDVSWQGSVPGAAIAFFDSQDYKQQL
jgi:hypothetical protein